ncbi:unnamed protein product, partial [Urochloa humidicola]
QSVAPSALKSYLLLFPLLCSFPHQPGATTAEHGRSFSHPQINSNSLSSSTTSASALHPATSNPPALSHVLPVADALKMFDEMGRSYKENREAGMVALTHFRAMCNMMELL